MPDPLTIRQITVRECRQRDEGRGKYTTGDLEELVWLVVAISDGQDTGYGECIPTSIYYEPGHIGRSSIDDQINVHANWAGGFGPALRKAQLAALAGLPTMIGSTVYLGSGSAAYQTLASVLPLDAPCEQQFSATRGRLSAIASPYELRDGNYYITDAPGLGIEVDTDLLDDLTVRQETLG